MTSVINGYGRLTDLQGELDQLGKKRQIAAANDATAEQLALIDGLIGELQTAIVDAAIAEIGREVDAGKDEANRLRRGRPAKPGALPNGPGDQNPPVDKDKDKDKNGTNGDTNGGNGGGGGGGGGSGLLLGIPGAPPQAAGTRQIPPAQCIYVRSDDSVWGWSRFEQVWKQQDFASPIQQVTPVGGGLLVVARSEAAIFDCALAEWLNPLRTNETLISGAVTAGAAPPPIQPSGPPPQVPAGAFRSPPSADSPDFSAPGGAPEPQPATPIVPEPDVGPVAVAPDPDLNPGVVIDPEPPAVFPEPPEPDPDDTPGGAGGGGPGGGDPGSGQG